ncbi:LON peptidase substrate-binding domain-containing protein [Oleiharenicola sp. Vm1]|uniref:LON peptidase substrate-binding domain-containing protein n=1 Tax=Oleiharenicola sp. Vm1 TaxID=3398393 RepID=UPI0039F5E41F
METIELPPTVPVMTLPNTVFFPQSLLPLHIFEPRYRAMLRDVLATNRLFAVAHLDTTHPSEPGVIEPPHRIASVGVVRACQEAADGTSNLLLQGVCRVEISAIVREQPYRLIAVRPLTTVSGGNHTQLEIMRLEVLRLVQLRRRLGTPAPKGMTQFLETIEDFDTFADVAVFNLCDNVALKQRLLEELDTRQRLKLFAAQLKLDIEDQRLRKKLQGELSDDGIANN